MPGDGSCFGVTPSTSRCPSGHTMMRSKLTVGAPPLVSGIANVLGRTFPSNPANALLFSIASVARYCSPPTLSNAANICSRNAADVLFLLPFGRPGPALPDPIPSTGCLLFSCLFIPLLLAKSIASLRPISILFVCFFFFCVLLKALPCLSNRPSGSRLIVFSIIACTFAAAGARLTDDCRRRFDAVMCADSHSHQSLRRLRSTDFLPRWPAFSVQPDVGSGFRPVRQDNSITAFGLAAPRTTAWCRRNRISVQPLNNAASERLSLGLGARQPAVELGNCRPFVKVMTASPRPTSRRGRVAAQLRSRLCAGKVHPGWRWAAARLRSSTKIVTVDFEFEYRQRGPP